MQIIKSARTQGEKPKLLRIILTETESFRVKTRESKLNKSEVRRVSFRKNLEKRNDKR